jgi:hypothetical protein
VGGRGDDAGGPVDATAISEEGEEVVFVSVGGMGGVFEGKPREHVRANISVRKQSRSMF